MSEISNKTENSTENQFQQPLSTLGKKTFKDMCKSYCVALIVFAFLGIIADSFWGNIILQVLLLVGYGYPLYTNAWGEGYRDLNKFEFNRIEQDKLRGFKFGAIALIPHCVLSIILLITYFTGSFEMMFFYRLINVYTMPILNMIVSPDILTIDYNIIQILIYIIIPPIFTVSFVGIGYYLGFSDFAIIDRIVYSKKTTK